MDEINESIAQIIEDMYFTNIKQFTPDAFGLEEMKAKYKDETFWYVCDETADHVIAHRVKGRNEPVTYLFEDQNDAEEWRWIGTKSGTHSNHKLVVESDSFPGIAERVEGELGQFEVLTINHEQAQNVFVNYPELAITKDVEERRKDNPEPHEDDNL